MPIKDKDKIKKEIISILPQQPGVYRFLDKDGKIIYVGWNHVCMAYDYSHQIFGIAQVDKERGVRNYKKDVLWIFSCFLFDFVYKKHLKLRVEVKLGFVENKDVA